MTDPLLQRFTQEIMPQEKLVLGVGLDIACSSGRNLVYLANLGWKMTGIDRSAESLQQANELAGSSNVEISTYKIDMEMGTNPFINFQEHSFDLVTVSRYLHCFSRTACTHDSNQALVEIIFFIQKPLIVG